MEHITEAELADWEAALAAGQWLPRLVSLGLIAQVRALQGEVQTLTTQRDGWCDECFIAIQNQDEARAERDALAIRVVELEQQERDRDEALAGQQPSPEEMN